MRILCWRPLFNLLKGLPQCHEWFPKPRNHQGGVSILGSDDVPNHASWNWCPLCPVRPSAPGACLSLIAIPQICVGWCLMNFLRQGRCDTAILLRSRQSNTWNRLRFDMDFLVHSCFTLVPKVTKKLMEVKAVSTPEERSSLMAILESVYRCATC